MNDSIAAYARAKALQPPQGQTRVLRMNGDTDDSIVLEARGDAFFVYRIHPLPFPTELQLLRAMTRSDARHGHGVRVGLRGSGHDAALFMVIRLGEESPDPARIDRALDTLKRWQAAWTSACDTF